MLAKFSRYMVWYPVQVCHVITVFITDTLGTSSNVLIVSGGESYAVRVKSYYSVFIPLDVHHVFWSRHCIESAVSLIFP